MGIFGSKKYDSGLSAQLRAVSPWDTEQIKSLLRRGADPDTRTGHEPTPLIAAAASGCLATMKVLIDNGAGLDKAALCKLQSTPLEAAVYNGQFEAAQFLLDRGAKINGVAFMGPPFHAAFASKNIEMLQFLLEHGADPNKRLTGFTPAKVLTLELQCDNWRHDIRKSPKPGCVKCANRLLLITMLSLLRQYKAKPLVAGSSNRTDLLGAYIDLIANIEKWEERGSKVVDWLTDVTINDPAIRGMLMFLLEGALGAMGIPTPIDLHHSMGPLAGMAGLPDLAPGPDFKKVPHLKPEDRTMSARYRSQTEEYMRELMRLRDG